MIESEGYAVREGVFSEAECESVLSDLSKDVDINRAGVRNLMSLDVVARVAKDERLLRLTQDLTGIMLIPFKAILFNKTGKTNWLVAWHQDTAPPLEQEITEDGWGPCSVKNGVTFSHAPSEILRQILAFRIHLDPSTSINGPLRVIPGSHHDRSSDDDIFRQIVQNGKKVELTVGRGGVIAMRPMLIHASSKCETDEPRRVLHIEYAPTMNLVNGIHLATA
jgi:hypothetical protein